jgi:UDP-N-acetylmuramate dehydrogenase
VSAAAPPGGRGPEGCRADGERADVERAVAVAAGILGDLARIGMPLGPLTTYRVGGPAAIGVVARHVDDLRAVAAAAAASGLEVLIVGRGSNLLVADAGFAGLAVTLDAEAFGSFEVDGAARRIRAGAALPLPALARRSVEAGWSGLGGAVGVPGAVGGGVRMNAGGHGSDIAESLVRARVVDLAAGSSAEEHDLGPSELHHGYRRSSLRAGQVVTSADFVVLAGDSALGRETIREIVRWRREHQPGGQNAGSVFVNPVPGPRSSGGTLMDDGASPATSRSAGWLIEAAGLKGLRVGSAVVSDKHANFLQADPGGSADDVRALMATVRARVLDQWGVALRTEIRLIGFPQESTSSGELG